MNIFFIECFSKSLLNIKIYSFYEYELNALPTFNWLTLGQGDQKECQYDFTAYWN